jgi:iron complex outermembrane recepter protein
MTPLRPLLFSMPLALCIGTAMAEDQTYSINIPAQSLAGALDVLAEQTGIKPFSPDSIVAGKTSPTVSGRLTPRQALEQVLSGSGLNYKFNDDHAVAITAPDSGAMSTMPAVKVVGKVVYAENDPYNPDYNRSNASSATKTDTPIMETPISVQVVPRAVIQDQQAVQVGDAIKNVSGVYQGFSLGGFAEQFMIRGFNTQYNNYVDGFSVPASRITLANAERVEVVKGAAANLYGRIEPGGLINVVTKRPQATPYYALEQQFGSFDFYRTTADATGAINQDGSVMYRINFEYLDKHSFRDYGFTNRKFLAPSLTWKISDSTQIDLDFFIPTKTPKKTGAYQPA